ncbi:complement C1q-like protein 4 isoform X1 [Sphaeramia orbicularis]|uniref:complement C1q-like protein 4 isoform X1 n=1 Tax=Sphaeramia orbicularis TaxID=375764 RepID=UPI00117EE352|nr:complement C1q-like protein 4 isoform X1 [Sphaeramia orbicularis]
MEMDDIYDNVENKPAYSRPLAHQTAPQVSNRGLRGAVVFLGLLCGFLVVGLIGVRVHYFLATRALATEKSNLTEERDRLNACLVKATQELKKLGMGPSNVVFSASLVTTTDWTYEGPFDTDVTLIFKRVVTNVGNGYNSNTGIFTAPTKGVYYFSFTGCVGTSGKLNAALVKNSELISAIYDTRGTYGCGSNSVTVQLEVSDTVFIRLWNRHSIFDQSRLSTFTGFLLFAV